MKILYVASHPADNSLLLEDEITVLQSVAADVAATGVRFTFLPKLPIERLPSEISKISPEILHISAHGSQVGLTLATGWDADTVLTARALKAFVAIEKPPRLIILRACNSAEIAEEIVARHQKDGVGMAIGATVKVSTGSSREAIRLLYERLLSGHPVETAFEACQEMMHTITHDPDALAIYHADDIDPAREFFLASPQIVARFESMKPNSEGQYPFLIGVLGCPPDTHQVVFFTDDETYITDDEEMENDLTEVVRSAAARGAIWTETTWKAYGQIRIFASGVTMAGEQFMASSSLTDALLRYQRIINKNSAGLIPPKMTAAIDKLISLDGAELDSAAAESKARLSSKKTKSKKRK